MLSKVISRLIAHANTVWQVVLNLGNFRASPLKVHIRGQVWTGRRGRIICLGRMQTRLGCLLNAHTGQLVLGDRVSLNNYCSINCHERIELGENVLLGEGVRIYDHDHVFSPQTGVERTRYVTAPVVIGRNTWIGSNSLILKGVTIGENVVVAAGSVVTRSVPSGTVFVQKRVSELR